MKNKGLINIHNLKPIEYEPQKIMAWRIPQLNAQGLVGYAEFSHKNWWVLTLKGFELIRERFKGQGLRCTDRLYNYLVEKEDSEFEA